MKKVKLGTWEVDWMDQEGVVEMDEPDLKRAPAEGELLPFNGKRVKEYVKRGSVVIFSKKQVKTCV